VIAIENVRLFNETKEALEQQTVISEILRVISSSPTDVQPVFDAIVKSGVHLFGGMNVGLRLVKGDHTELVASTLPIQETGGVSPISLEDERFMPTSQAILRREVVQVPDAFAEEWVGTRFRQRAEQRGIRAILVAPMLRENNAIGTINVSRATPGPFTDKQIALLKTFADQAVIAIENVRLFNETKEALERQTATAEILKVISSSPTDVQPVLDTVAERSNLLCRAEGSRVWLAYGGQLHPMASYGTVYGSDSQGEVLPLRTTSPVGRAFLERRCVHVEDIVPLVETEYPDTREIQARYGFRTVLTVPMLREGESVGVIALLRFQMRPFASAEISLVQTFADQAVIAIENVRLFKELQARNIEITESLEQQTATADILRVISSSPTDLQPVFDTILEHATRLCDAHLGLLGLYDGERYKTVAQRGGNADFANWVIARGPYEPDTGGGLARMITERRPIHLPDLRESPSYRNRSPNVVQLVEVAGARTYISVPMLKDDRVVGGITIYRPEVRPFTENQIDLVSTFANQAVIAIENVRLFKELQARNAEITEALEQQTATAEILKVISSSPTDLQPVFEAILEKAIRLCDAHMGHLQLYDGEKFQTVAQQGATAEYAKFHRERGPFRPPPGSGLARMIAERQPIQIADRRDSAEYRDGNPSVVALVELGGARTFIAVPMLKEGRVVGGISIYRPEVRPFTQKQIDLVSTFASQAVIAIENVRLFNEINEALQRQTSIAEILRVISSTPTDVMPVLEAVTHRAAQLCDSPDARLYLVEGDALRYVVGFGTLDGARPNMPLTRGNVIGRAIFDRTVMHVEDLAAAFDEFPEARVPQQQFGHRTTLAVPLVRENRAFGAILMRRKEVRPFSEKQVDLVKTFADQAVIAIHNVRLFKEINEALEQQTATSEVLKVISRSTFDLGPVLETLVENARKLCNADRATISRADKDGNYMPVVERALEPSAEYLAYMQRHPIRPDRGSAVGRAVLERRPVHIPDVLADPEYSRRDLADLGSFRTVLAVPMLREGEPIGVFVLTHTKEVKPFTEKQVEVVTTFADQAVIAIENVRLFQEIQDKSRQLEVASRHKSQFLANMSHELRTPLNAILGYTELVLDGIYGDVSAKVRDVMGRVDKSGRHLLGLINDVLDLSKIEAGQLTLALADYSLADVVQTVFTAVESLAAEKKLPLKVALASDLPRGRGDDRRLTQVLLNLVGNAIKFTEAGEVRLEARCADGAFVVSVADTGPGISEADQQRIFEEFQQVDDSATRKKGGTGLGLSIARRIIELHGGRIQVESVPGRGSTFTVTLPVRVERQAGVI